MPIRRAPLIQRGFTLVEVMVAISILAIMATMSWRALDGMARAQTQAQRHTDDVMTLNAALSQWKTDLDRQIATLNPAGLVTEPIPMFWDGQSMRITRYSSLNASEGLQVVAWAQQNDAQHSAWRRWQSGPLTTVGAWRSAWAAAEQWAAQSSTSSNSSTSTPSQATTLTPLQNWQLSYHRGGAWTNALSAATTQMQTGGDTMPTHISTQSQGLVDGVRLILTLPPHGSAFNGTITVDWVRPTRGGDQ